MTSRPYSADISSLSRPVGSMIPPVSYALALTRHIKTHLEKSFVCTVGGIFLILPTKTKAFD